MNEPSIDNNEEDEEDDEEYVPGQDKDDDNDDNDNDNDDDDDDASALGNSGLSLHAVTHSLTSAKRKAVDDSFEQLFGYPFGTFDRPKRVLRLTPLDKTLEILEEMFGPRGAAQILSRSTLLRPVKRLPLPDTVADVMTEEVRHYAGQSIVVQRKVVATTVMASDTKPQSIKTSGLDILLQELDGPSKLTTVAKTSADWDQFKVKEGLDDDLTKQAQGKNAFLKKKDFLDRVDARRFEVEKEVRDSERTTRGK
jgi:Bucentaur or craniofacial development